MSNTCNLVYNSEIGLDELYHCSEWIMSEEEIDCNDDCLDEIGDRIGKNTDKMTVR